MTQFNPENKAELTYGECLDPAMKITDEEDAKQYFIEYVKFIQKYLDKEPRTDNKTAEEIAKINLGYYAGYYNDDVRKNVERLFLCEHPYFGKIENGKPTPESAFEMGKKLGTEINRRNKLKKINGNGNT